MSILKWMTRYTDGRRMCSSALVTDRLPLHGNKYWFPLCAFEVLSLSVQLLVRMRTVKGVRLFISFSYSLFRRVVDGREHGRWSRKVYRWNKIGNFDTPVLFGIQPVWTIKDPFLLCSQVTFNIDKALFILMMRCKCRLFLLDCLFVCWL